MKLDAILHIPMSEYAHGLDENRIVFRLRCARGDLKRCTLYYGDTACRVTPILFTPAPMELVLSDQCHDYYQLILDSPYQRLFYYFELDDGERTFLYYGDVFTDHLVDDRSEYFKLPFNHRADIAKVPDWVYDAVVYNIFPDSFASGEKSISLQPAEQLYNGVPVKGRLGGTLWGAAENAGYLQELGVNCVYLNPIFAAGEYHKYDLLDYYHVDPCFGGDDAFRAMVDEFHKRGIRVIIDGVFNHCGWQFFAFDDVVRNQERSQYKDWFYHLEITRPVDAGGLLDLGGDGVKITLGVPQAEHRHGAGIHQNQPNAMVDQPERAQQAVDGEHGQDGGKRVEQHQAFQHGPPPGEPPAGEAVGCRDSHRQGQRYGGCRQQHRIAEPGEDVLPKQHLPVVVQRELLGNEGEVGAEQAVLAVKGHAQGVEDGNQRDKAQRDEKHIQRGQPHALLDFLLVHRSPSSRSWNLAENTISRMKMMMEMAEL